MNNNMNNNDFPININKLNFPNKNNLQTILNNIKINELLTRIKNDIITANNNNLNYITLYNTTLQNFNNTIILDIREHLISLNYKINDVEDTSNNIIGWKLYWQ